MLGALGITAIRPSSRTSPQTYLPTEVCGLVRQFRQPILGGFADPP